MAPTTMSSKFDQLPEELIHKVLSRLNPLDRKLLSQYWNNYERLRATLLRDFIIDLADFSASHPSFEYKIELVNKYPDEEDIVVATFLYDPSAEFKQARDTWNIAHFILSKFGSKSPKRKQKELATADINYMYDYVARTTDIRVHSASGEPRKELMTIVKRMKDRVFPYSR